MDVWELPLLVCSRQEAKARITFTLHSANSFLSLPTWTTSHEGNPFKRMCSRQSIYQKIVSTAIFQLGSIVQSSRTLRTLWIASNNSHGKGPSDHTRIGTGLEFSKHRDVMSPFARLCSIVTEEPQHAPTADEDLEILVCFHLLSAWEKVHFAGRFDSYEPIAAPLAIGCASLKIRQSRVVISATGFSVQCVWRKNVAKLIWEDIDTEHW